MKRATKLAPFHTCRPQLQDLIWCQAIFNINFKHPLLLSVMLLYRNGLRTITVPIVLHLKSTIIKHRQICLKIIFMYVYFEYWGNNNICVLCQIDALFTHSRVLLNSIILLTHSRLLLINNNYSHIQGFCLAQIIHTFQASVKLNISYLVTDMR